jgi:predicted metal-dependent phosphotriesterase family hydrolase
MIMRFAAPGLLILALGGCADRQQIITVTGPIDANKLGFTLPHEHVLVDFIGADSVSPHRYNQDSAFQVALPYIEEFKRSGGETMFECTPAYLGRDAVLLRRLATATNVNIVTNTGYYGAVGEKYYPDHAFAETAEQIADRWIAEFNDGIEGTGIRPGFMKLSADKAPLTETQRKMVHAAAITHLATGLTIAIHTGNGAAAQEELSIIESHGISPQAFIWIHAQSERDSSIHRSMAERGAWVEFDGLNPDNVDRYVSFLKNARAGSYLDKVLVSHDAGWYNVGNPGGVKYRGYTTLKNELLTSLERADFSRDDIDLITKKNPAKAFAVSVRRR